MVRIDSPRKIELLNKIAHADDAELVDDVHDRYISIAYYKVNGFFYRRHKADHNIFI